MTNVRDQQAALVRLALYEFEDRPLSTTIRRAARIPALIGDSYAFARFTMDVRPVLGSGQANAEEIRAVLAYEN